MDEDECRHGINPLWCASCLAETHRRTESAFAKQLREALGEDHQDLIPDT